MTLALEAGAALRLRGSTRRNVAESTGVETPVEGEEYTYSENHLGEYTSESPVERGPSRQGPAPGRSYGTGRRKEAVARVRIVPGSGQWTINGQSLEAYFPNKVHQQTVKDPLTTVEAEDRYDVYVRLNGGGPSGQAGALRMGMARALSEIDVEENRPALKKAGFLTRDSRTKERKKYGLKKARKAPQYSKR